MNRSGHLSQNGYGVCGVCVVCGVCGVGCVCCVCCVCGVCGVCGTNDSRHGESWRVRMMHLIRVAEHLGASCRRPRHPFPALMAGATHGRVPVYTAQKRDLIKPRTAPVEQHNRDTTTCVAAPTATIALQLELEEVVVVSTNNVNAAEPAIQHANTPNVYKGTGCN